MALNVGTIRGFLELEDNFSPKLERAGRLVAQSGDKWTKSGADMQSAGAKMTLGITAPIVAAGGAAIKFATDFNAGMANVATLIPGNADRINELKGEVQDLAIETGKSTTDLSDGLFQTVSAFGDSAEAADILGINARAAAAGLATTTDAINLTSAVTKGYGDTSAGAVQHAADLAFMANKLGQTTFPELAGSIGRVTPLTAELGVKQEELFGVMATFTGVTGNAAEVSTQLRGVLQGLLSPTDAMKDLYGQLGVESGNALIEQRGLAGAIETVVAAANAGDNDLADYIGSIEGQTLALSATGAQADVFRTKLAAMTNVAGAAEEAFREQSEGINAAGFSWQQFQQQLAVAAQKLGDVLLPVASRFLTNVAMPLLDWVTSAVEWFGNLPEPVQTVGVAIAGIAAAAGPVLIAVGTLVSSFGAVAGVVGPLITSLGGAGLGGAIASVATGLLGPAGLVAGVGAASVAMGSWINENIIGTQALADFGEWLGIAEPAVQLTAEELANMRDRQRETNEAVTAGAGAVAGIVDPTTAAGVAAAEAAANYSLLPPGFDASGSSAGRARPPIDDLNRSLWGLKTTAEVLEESMEEMLGPFEDLTEVSTEFAVGPPANVPPLIDTLDRSMERWGVTIPNTGRELQEVTNLLDSGQVPAKQMAGIVEELRDRYERLGVMTPELNDQLRELEKRSGAAAGSSGLGGLFDKFKLGIPFIDDALSSLTGFISKGLGGLGDALGGLFGGGGSGGGGGLLDGLFGGLLGGLTGGGGIGSMVSGLLGTGLSAIMGPLGGLVSSGITKLGGLLVSGIKRLFGGPSAEELAGRDVAHAYRSNIRGMLGATHEAEIAAATAGGGTREWAMEVIALRDSYLAMGRSEEEALAISERLWQAEKDGPEAVKAVIATIAPTLDSVNAAMASSGLGLTDLRDLAINAANVMQVSVSEAFGLIAEGAITSMADAHAAAADAMANTAADAAGSVAEAQEAATTAVEQTATDAAEASAKAAEDARQKAEEAKRAVAEQAAAAEEAARRIAGIDINIPVRFDVQDVDLGNIPVGEMDRRPEHEGFAGGTDFDFLNFGRGTDTTLHGEEAVVTRSQGRDLASMVAAAARAGGASARGGGGGAMVVKVMLPNGKVLAETVLDEMPRMLSHRGVSRRN